MAFQIQVSFKDTETDELMEHHNADGLTDLRQTLRDKAKEKLVEPLEE